MIGERVRFPVAVHLFLLDGGSVLLQRRFQTGYEDGNYSVVAGHMDGGEDVYAAMIREAREEAGINIRRDDLEIVQVMHRWTTEDRIDYFFACRTWTGKISIMEPDKCDELRWAPLDGLPANMVDYVEAAIQNYKKKKKFTLFGWKGTQYEKNNTA